MKALLLREIRLALQSGGGAGTALLFYFAVVIAVPFGVGPKPELLSEIGAAILWTGALLSSLLGLDRLFRPDFEDGSLDQYLIGRHSIVLVAFLKAFAHWLVTGLPLTLAVPIFGLFLSMDWPVIGATMLTLMIGTPAFSFIGAVGAAVAVALPRGGLLVSVLVLPLCIPSIIFGVGAVRGFQSGIDPFLQPLLFLAALSLGLVVLGSVAAAYALRQAIS